MENEYEYEKILILNRIVKPTTEIEKVELLELGFEFFG